MTAIMVGFVRHARDGEFGNVWTDPATSLEPVAPEVRPDPDARLLDLWRDVKGGRPALTGRPLSPRPSFYLYLYAVRGLSCGEIAAREGVDRSAVSQALRKLAPPGAFNSVSALRKREAS